MLKLVDNDGGVVFALCLKIAGNEVEVYEVGEGGLGQQKLFSYPKADTARIMIEFYQDERIANIYLNDTCVAKTSVFASAATEGNTPMTAVIEATKVRSKLYVDNLKVESR